VVNGLKLYRLSWQGFFGSFFDIASILRDWQSCRSTATVCRCVRATGPVQINDRSGGRLLPQTPPRL
jgi:hypothetical protein